MMYEPKTFLLSHNSHRRIEPRYEKIGYFSKLYKIVVHSSFCSFRLYEE